MWDLTLRGEGSLITVRMGLELVEEAASMVRTPVNQMADGTISLPSLPAGQGRPSFSRSRLVPFQTGGGGMPVYLTGPVQAQELMPTLARLTGKSAHFAVLRPGDDVAAWLNANAGGTGGGLEQTPTELDLTGIDAIVVFARGAAFAGSGPVLRTLTEAAVLADQAARELASGKPLNEVAQSFSDWKDATGEGRVIELRLHPAGRPPAEVIEAAASLSPGEATTVGIVADDGVYVLRRRATGE